MGATINAGRWTAGHDGELVVFIIGAKVRNPLRALKALPVLSRMPKMLAELEADPSTGLLGYQRHGGPFGVIVQYWRSFEDLERYARDPEHVHAGAWRDWYRLGQGDNTSVGIWHETFRVRPGEFEAIYGNMPSIGLGKATSVRPVGRATADARARIGITDRSDQPPAPVS